MFPSKMVGVEFFITSLSYMVYVGLLTGSVFILKLDINLTGRITKLVTEYLYINTWHEITNKVKTYMTRNLLSIIIDIQKITDDS